MTVAQQQQDVFEQKGEESSPWETERQFRLLLEQAPDSVFLHGLDGLFVYVNNEACAGLGYSRDELLRMHPWDFVVNDSREHILRLWQGMVAGVPVLADGLFRRKDGTTFPAEVRLARFEEGGRDWVAAFCRDISSRRRAEDAVRSQERDRLARDIHDALAHGLTAIAVQLEAARQVIGDEPGEAAVHVGNALRLARESLREARRSVRALRPEALERGDLTEALRDLVGCLSTGRREAFHFHLYGHPRPLPGEAETHLLRVGQEALTNVLKHARAANVLVELHYSGREARLHVEDDGQGFGTEREGAPAEGVGLTGMRERAEKIGGQLTLRPSPPRGVAGAVTVPGPADAQGGA